MKILNTCSVVCFLFSIFFVSCKKNKGHEIDINMPRIDFSFSTFRQKQSDLFEVEEVVRLQTTDHSLIGGITAIISKPSGFYILDKTGNQIIKFSSQGDFIYTINKQGRGSGEFLSLYGISVDPKDQYLYVYDGQREQIICYDAGCGDYVRSFGLEHNAGSFSVLPDGKHFIFYCDFLSNKRLEKDGCYPNLVITDSRGEIKQLFSYFDKKINTQNVIGIREGIFTNSDFNIDFYCFTQFQDIIYKATSEDVQAAYFLNYMNDNQSKNEDFFQRTIDYDNIDFDRNKEDFDRKDFYRLMKFNFTDRFMYFAGNCEGKMFYFIYDKKRAEAINIATLKRDVIGDDMYFRTADRDFFYLHISTSILKKSIKSMPEGYDSKIVSVVESLEDDANPVVIKLKMKDR